jgi:diazepam-binding inhibitor (GABA receptor modulating acyl-CoA-binding protein)
MSELKQQFETAALEVQQLSRRPDTETLLQLYAFYKQATTGDASGKRPGFTDPVGKAKYDAWAALRGVNQEKAMRAYIGLVGRLQTQGA